VHSELGKGTTFKIYFPQVQSALEPPRARITPTEAVGGNETVLLVEDEPVVRELAAITLREKGYTVVEAVNGEEGLRLARQHDGKIDLVLTDVVMPSWAAKKWPMPSAHLIRTRRFYLPRDIPRMPWGITACCDRAFYSSPNLT